MKYGNLIVDDLNFSTENIKVKSSEQKEIVFILIPNI